MKTEKKFQREVVKAVTAYFTATAAAYRDATSSDDVAQIRAERSAVLMEAPTGVGKTYMASRIIGRFSQHRKVLWFWFSPWEHLAEQTEAALMQDAHGLRVSDLSSERLATALTGSRVYSLVWASLAARADVKRKTRQADDGKQDLDSFIADARAAGFQIGVVIDEAHHGISGETEAARLLKECLVPDYHLFVTATPDDKDLAALQTYMGLTRIRREVATREDGIAEGLIKPDVKVVYFEECDDSAGYLSRGTSLENAAIGKAVGQHEALKAEIARLPGVVLTPLLLVQVGSGSADAELFAKAALIKAGIPEAAIRIHTANKPDRNLQQIASDQSVEALIFKMAVATGFDAPRAFTLVSMRSSRSEQFGLQVLGRILRVPAQLQVLANLPAMLQHGYVFLVDKTTQDGLTAAADRIKSIQRGVAEFCVASSIVDEASGKDVSTGERYALNAELPVPTFITQANTRNVSDDEDLEAALAEQVRVDPALLEAALLNEVTFGTAVGNVFGKGRETSTYGVATEAVNFKEIARKALAMLGTVPEADLQLLLQALAGRLAAAYAVAGLGPVDDDRVLHAVYLLGQIDPRNPVLETLRMFRTWTADQHVAEALPPALVSAIELPSACRNVYGVLPDGQWDSPDERRFAVNRLEDDDAPVIWWHRNPARKPFSIGLAKPEGGMFYPDFVVRVAGLQTKDELTLIEVKGEGWLTDAKVSADIATEHPNYGRPLFVVEVAGEWRFVAQEPNGELVAGDKFTWKAVKARLAVRGQA